MFNEAENKKLLFNAGMNQQMLADKLGVKPVYVSVFITGRGNIPRYAWDILYDYFLDLRYGDHE